MVTTAEIIIKEFDRGKSPKEIFQELSEREMQVPLKTIQWYYAAWKKRPKNFSEYMKFSKDRYFREIYEGREISRENPYILMSKILEIKRSVEPEHAEEILKKSEEYKMLEEKTAGMTPRQRIRYFGRLVRGLNLLRECGKI